MSIFRKLHTEFEDDKDAKEETHKIENGQVEPRRVNGIPLPKVGISAKDIYIKAYVGFELL